MHPESKDPSERAGFWSGVLREHHRALFGAAMAMCGRVADAEDLVQDTLVRLVRSSRRVDDPLAYAVRSMRNGMVSRVRRDALHHRMVLKMRGTVDTGRAPSDRVSELLAAVDRLPEQQQEVIVLRSRCGLSFVQIAMVLDEPVGTVSSRYTRAVASLKMMLEGVSHE